MSKFPKIIFAKLIHAKNCQFLFLNHVNPIENLSENELKKLIPQRLWPTRIFWNISLANFKTLNGNFLKILIKLNILRKN